MISNKVHRRVRQQIIDYLAFVSSPAVIIQYQKKVPHVSVIREIVLQWEDWVCPNGQFERSFFLPEVYSNRELDAIAAFNSVWDQFSTQVGDSWSDINEFLASSLWKEYAKEARKALNEFSQ